MAKKKMYVGGIGAVIIAASFLFISSNVSSYPALDNFDGVVEFYKSMSCGCCGLHASYLSGAGNLNVDVMIMDDVEVAKDKLGIPEDLRTCHTFIIGDYYVEGHVPLEALEKLISEKPDIAGIALPGMPAGSPGMPGKRSGDWVIYAVNHDGSYEEWMVI